MSKKTLVLGASLNPERYSYKAIKMLQDKINNTEMSTDAKEKCVSELKKLKMMSPMSAEASVVRTYIETIVNLPWSKSTKINHDLSSAEITLDNDHYGLDKVKERIIEYLAVQQRVDKLKAPILCLVGPPGVGKTSLIRRFVLNEFSEDYISTIGVRVSKKVVEYKNETIKLMIWDVAGTSGDEKIPKAYFLGAHAAMFVFDVSREETYLTIEGFLNK